MEGTQQDVTFHSEILDHSFDLRIYTPDGFTPMSTYHLIIAQDGKDYFRLGHLVRYAEQAMEEGAPDTVIVGVPYPSVRQRRNWYHPDEDGHTDYLQFMASELLPFMEKEYHAESSPQARTLLGDSLGGTVSLMAALDYPNIFQRVVMHSPLVNDTVFNGLKNSEDWPSFTMYHTIGTEEQEVDTTAGTVEDFLKPNRDLYEYLSAKASHYHYKELEGGHLWKVWEQDVIHSLAYMFDIELD